MTYKLYSYIYIYKYLKIDKPFFVSSVKYKHQETTSTF